MTAHRVSTVEAFRQWEDNDEADTEALIAKINGVSEPSLLMEAGTAFHKVLENMQAGAEVTQVRANGFTFHIEADLELELDPIRELRGSKTFVVDGQPIVITGQVDSISGRTITDHKTTGRFDPERYLMGYQWRLYCSIFGARCFRWNVFEIAPSSEDREFWVHAYHRLVQFAYPALEDDCQALVTRYARFVREHVEEAV